MRGALFFLLFFLCNASFTMTSTDIELAVYYGEKNIPELKLYQQVVVQPNIALNPKTFRKAVVYVSLGEAYSADMYGKPIDKRWIIGQNKNWHTLILDQTNLDWQQFFINQVITPLWDKGYRGFYLDTLDSYRLAVQTPAQIKKQQAGLVRLIKAIKAKYPDAELILNRGFELLPEVSSLISRVTVESVFAGWNNAQQTYFDVSDTERTAVLEEIRRVQAMGIPVTIIDYLPENQAAKAYQIAEKIMRVGCNPWVTNRDLTAIYLKPQAASIARKVLILYRGQLNNTDERIGSSAIQDLSMPINHLGYAVEVRNVNEPLPANLSPKTYAGIVISIDGLLMGREQELHDWYVQQMHKKIPLVILSDFGFMVNAERLKPFGLSFPLLTHKPHTLHITKKAPLIGFELQPVIKPYNFIPIQIQKGKGISLLKIKDDVGLETDIAGITVWGGYYIGPSFLPTVTSGENRWGINPFEFFKQALHLPDTPIPDTTTENGMRLMFTHIDGDGFSNKGEWFDAPFAGEIMRQFILERYQLPVTVSIVQSEIEKNGLHAADSEELEAIAKRIFALPYVEIASHTYSHPFNWYDAQHVQGKGLNPYHLPIPGYRFNLEKEIKGSVDYINTSLAPKEKPCAVFLWSGEGDVPEEALKMSTQLGLRNLNPGNIITRFNPSLTRVSALGVNEGPYFQVFAPIGNDIEAQGKSNKRLFYSLINILHALKMTESPRRLKPIDVYVHFFTLAQPGGIKALQAVYDWVLTQAIMPVFASEYIDKVLDFNTLFIIPERGGWKIITNDALREFRVPENMGFPDLANSQHVLGFNTYQHTHYVHLAPGGEAFLKLTKARPKLPYLVSANARITHFVSEPHHLQYTFSGHVPIQFTLANANQCNVFYQLYRNSRGSTSRGLSAGSMNLARSLDSADKPRNVDYSLLEHTPERRYFIKSIIKNSNIELYQFKHATNVEVDIQCH